MAQYGHDIRIPRPCQAGYPLPFQHSSQGPAAALDRWSCPACATEPPSVSSRPSIGTGAHIRAGLRPCDEWAHSTDLGEPDLHAQLLRQLCNLLAAGTNDAPVRLWLDADGLAHRIRVGDFMFLHLFDPGKDAVADHDARVFVAGYDNLVRISTVFLGWSGGRAG